MSETSFDVSEDYGEDSLDSNTDLIEDEMEGEESDGDTELYDDVDSGDSSESDLENENNSENENAENNALRTEIKEKSDYSDEINDHLKSVEELEVYQKAGLKEDEIEGKACLVRDDIDWSQKDEFGRTNAMRVEQKNLSPISKDGETIELHHIGQKDDSPLAEFTTTEHRGKGNDTILHDKTKESEIDRAAFNTERINHWKARSEKEN